MTTERRHRRHPTELKLRLVEAYLNGEGSLMSIAKAHDITHTLLMIWVDKFRRGELTDEIDYVERSREAEAKIAALERKVGQLTMELDVLKVADITYIQLRKRFVYLAAILDAWSRKVVGYALGTTMETTLTLSALDAACNSRRPPPGLIHHSDRGGQYACKAYRDRLALLGIRGSMSRKGNPYDNAKAESFMKTLKHEEILKVDYEDLQDLQRRLPHFLEETYNQRCLHSALGYLPPDEFEQLHARRLVSS